VARLKDEIARLKGMVPDQSHVMVRGTGAELAARGLLSERDAIASQVGRTNPSGETRDPATFSKAYRDALSGCYACHQASEKPYLRPRVPDAPEGRMIEFSPSES
jgi:hypothetical protein